MPLLKVTLSNKGPFVSRKVWLSMFGTKQKPSEQRELGESIIYQVENDNDWASEKTKFGLAVGPLSEEECVDLRQIISQYIWQCSKK